MTIVGSLRSLFAPSSRVEVSARDEMNRAAAKSLPDRWIDAALPARCALCADTCTRVVCAPCERALVRVADESCPRCRLPSSNSEICGRCLRYPPKWARLSAMFMYEFPLDRLIVGAKHGRDWGVFDWAAGLVAEPPYSKGAILIPVPASPERLVERGYNQAALLARSLSKRFGGRVDNEAIVRIRETGSQANRNWVERRKNVKHAFAATRSLAGESVVLVDDVLTTGATLNECAAAARDAGAAQVDAFVIARVNPPRSRGRIQKFNRVVA
jgi:ComF family protein